jgi:membrane protease subunit HflC
MNASVRLVLQFGQIRQVIEEPGSELQDPVHPGRRQYYDDRILSLDTAGHRGDAVG